MHYLSAWDSKQKRSVGFCFCIPQELFVPILPVVEGYFFLYLIPFQWFLQRFPQAQLDRNQGQGDNVPNGGSFFLKIEKGYFSNIPHGYNAF